MNKEASRAFIAKSGPVGIWTRQFSFLRTSALESELAELEELGLRALWIGETNLKDPLVLAGLMLASTTNLVVCVGVSNIARRSAEATTSAMLTLDEAFGDRFLLGLGVGHRDSAVLGVSSAKAMAQYVSQVKSASGAYAGARRSGTPSIVLGALGPRMTLVAREKADGVLTYLSPWEHTGAVRNAIGENCLLCVEVTYIPAATLEVGLSVARNFLGKYVRLENYRNHWLRCGFLETDIVQMREAFVRRVVCMGGDEEMRATVHSHLASGADHVCVQVVLSDYYASHLEQWRKIVPVLLAEGARHR